MGGRRARLTLGIAGVAGGLAIATLIVHVAGGTKTVFPHLYYFPVVVAAVLGGPAAGIGVGAIGGILAGPVMPMSVDDGTSQQLSSWLMRLAFFAGIGGVTGAFAHALGRHLRDLDRLNDETVRAFVRAVDARDAYTARHSEKVAAYAAEIAGILGLDGVERIRWAGLLHDLGKLALPESILNKVGPLDEKEWDLVKQHPVDSARIVGGVERYRAYLPAIRHHHERFDGGGYPDGLRGEAIPLDARVLAVADAFDAMTSERSYRAAMPEEAALERIAAGAGTQFDPDIATAFVRARGSERVTERGDVESRGGSLRTPGPGARLSRSAPG